MIRLLVLAISALMAMSAGSASAAQMTVKVAGRPTAELHADIVKAATSVCRDDLRDSPYSFDMMPFCVREVSRAAIAKVGSPELIAYHKAHTRAGYLIKVSR